MVFITGDCHGNFRRFGRRYFPEQETMDRDDYIIVAGDFGGVWADTPEENYWLDWLEQRPFTTLFVDGNHENFRRLDTFPSHIWHGGSVHQIRPHVLHLMRGQLYEIGNKTFFTMGGAKSHDVEDGILDPADPNFHAQQSALKRSGRNRFRVLGRSWWPEELPSDEEYHTALKTLERTNWQDKLAGGLCDHPLRLHQNCPVYGPPQRSGPSHGIFGDGRPATGIRILVLWTLP